MITVRKANPEDAENIAILSSQLGYPTDVEKMEQRLRQVLEHPEHCVFVAASNGQVTGWIHGFYTLRVESDSFVEIGGLVVDESTRGHGIGKKLVSEVRKWADLRNCATIRVRSNVIREESHRFYLKNGFRETKSQKIFDLKLKDSRTCQ